MDAVPLVYRAKLAVAAHGTAVAAALLVVGTLAVAGAAWTVINPPTVEVTEPVATGTVGADVKTRAVVTGNTSLWERGTTLENRPVYPLDSAPRLMVEVRTSVPPGQPVDVSQSLTLVYRAEKDGEVFWRSTEPLVAEERTVRDGDVSAATSVDMRGMRAELEAINEELPGIGPAKAYLRLNVSYQAGGFAGSLSKTAPVTIRGSGYWIGGTLDAENTHRTPVTREVTRPPDLTMVVGLGLVGLVGFGGAGGVLYLSSRRLDRAAIADDLERRRYREWISVGRLGEFVTGQDVPMESLKDLVDVAIDSNNRVVHDRQRELFAVLADDVVYYYDPDFTGRELDIESDVLVPVRHDGGRRSAFAAAGRGRRSDPGTAEHPSDVVQISRDLGVEGGTPVATYRLSTHADEPVIVEVVDRALRGERPLEGFGPGAAVEVENGVGFTAAVSPHWTRVVRYAVVTDEPEPPVTEPQVRRVVTMGASRATDVSRSP